MKSKEQYLKDKRAREKAARKAKQHKAHVRKYLEAKAAEAAEKEEESSYTVATETHTVQLPTVEPEQANQRYCNGAGFSRLNDPPQLQPKKIELVRLVRKETHHKRIEYN